MTLRPNVGTPRPRTLARGAVAALALSAAAALGAPAAVAQTNGQGAPPFASGTLSSLSGSTLQVQGPTGTTKVVVTKSTEYRQEKSATGSDIAAGDCVRVFGTGSTADGIQATTVSVQKPTAKGCTARQGQNGRSRFGNGGPRGDGQFQPSANAPSGAPNGLGAPNGQGTPSGSSTPGGGNMGVAIGSIKSVSGNELTVKAQSLARPTANDGSTNNGSTNNTKPKSKTVNVTVSLTDSTAITQTVAASESDLAVGACVNAAGNADSVGTVTATTVTISQPQNGSCSAFGGFRGGFGGRFGGQGQSI